MRFQHRVHSDLEEIKNCYRMLYSHCSYAERREVRAFREYMNKVGAENFGLVDFAEGILCLPIYKNIWNLITMPENTIVVDCGCGCGLQQVLFKHCYKYIGIDTFNHFKKITDNAVFIQGDIAEVLPLLAEDSEHRYLGVSVLCTSVFGGASMAAFKEKFNYFISI